MNEELKNTSVLYSDLKNDLEYAYELTNKSYTHQDLIQMLLNGNIAEKQISALNFDYIKTQEDAKALLSNLTGCDGKIREAVAHRLHYILTNFQESRIIVASTSSKILADATIDINANICRLVVDSCALLAEFSPFNKDYTLCMVDFAKEAISELDKFIFRDKKYVINKQLFKLYWALEALIIFYPYAKKTDLSYILNKSVSQSEYTIREKAAQIINKSNDFIDLKLQLQSDENYYVRQIFKSSRHLSASQDVRP